MLLSEAIEALLVATRANGRSRRTVAAYREKLGSLMKAIGDVAIERITTDDLRRYVASELDAHSPYTAMTRTRALKRLFNWLMAEGRLETNPAARISVPRPRRRAPKAISLDDVAAMLATTEDDGIVGVRDRALLMFLIDTGCRVGGVTRLKVRDVDLETRRAMVTEKGGKSRLVMFTDATADALADWLAVRPGDKGPAVFTSLRRGAGLTANGIWQVLRRRATRAGMNGRACGPHSFRHAFARHFLLDGGDLGTLSDLMGHEGIGVTKQYYGVFTVQELQRQHDRHSPVLALARGSDV